MCLTIAAGLARLALEFDAARDLRDQLAGWVRARVFRDEAKDRARARAPSAVAPPAPTGGPPRARVADC